MIVNINEEFRVSVDNHNHTLERYKAPYVMEQGFYAGKTSKGKWSVIGYYPNMQQAINRAVQESLLNIESELTLDEYLKSLKEITVCMERSDES